jgi:hypothetical protein
MFRNFIPALADQYHVVAPDYPGMFLFGMLHGELCGLGSCNAVASAHIRKGKVARLGARSQVSSGGLR